MTQSLEDKMLAASGKYVINTVGSSWTAFGNFYDFNQIEDAYVAGARLGMELMRDEAAKVCQPRDTADWVGNYRGVGEEFAEDIRAIPIPGEEK